MTPNLSPASGTELQGRHVGADPNDVDDFHVTVDHDGHGDDEDIGGGERKVSLALPRICVSAASTDTARHSVWFDAVVELYEDEQLRNGEDQG